MSLDDWAVKNIEAEARKQWFGDYMKDKVDKDQVNDALDNLFEDPAEQDRLTSYEKYFKLSDRATNSTGRLSSTGEESEGIADS